MAPGYDVDVLVVGAGPAGLASALGLARRGLSCLIVDQADRRPAGTRCCVLWPSALDALSLLGGSVSELASHALPVQRKVFHLDEDSFGHSLAEPDAWCPLPLSVSQDVTERVLAADVARAGVPVRYAHRVTAVQDTADGISATVTSRGGELRVDAGWLVLATGAARPALAGVPYAGADYPGMRVLQADGWLGEEVGLPSEEHIFLAAGRHAGFVPLPGGRCRVFLAVPPDDADRARDAAGISALASEIARTAIAIEEPADSWRFTPREDVAAAMRTGRRFLVGEAATVAPLPVHGLNGGIQDAANLAWKLAAVHHGADGELLGTYHEERHAAALATLAHTRRVLGYGSAAETERTLRPRIRGRRHDVRTGPSAAYQASSLSVDLREHDDGPRAGQHLPDVALRLSDGRSIRVADVVRGSWTLLAVGAAAPAAAAAIVATAPLPDGLYLVRPDGYLGFTGGPDDGAALAAYCGRYVRSPGWSTATSYTS
jgi:NADPH-dependent dioxygenase